MDVRILCSVQKHCSNIGCGHYNHVAKVVSQQTLVFYQVGPCPGRGGNNCPYRP